MFLLEAGTNPVDELELEDILHTDWIGFQHYTSPQHPGRRMVARPWLFRPWLCSESD